MPESSSLVALIVDDSRIAQSVLFQTLDRMDVSFDEIRVANTGLEAVEMYKTIAQASRDVVILLDLDMPVMGGLEALCQIRMHEQEKRLQPSRIYVISATDDEETRQHCYASGADAYYTKPIQPRLLQKIIMEDEDEESRSG